ncbi:I78 family peptidase inhibitor [Sphingomonas silueang]|uniref:I78 family peptidase inhibitor n=1 Tax=Sphingomonas silueang TaxID=3156617 RepID=UPI0032B394A1
MKRIAWAGLMLAGCAPVAPDAPPLPRPRPAPPVAVMPPSPPVPPGDEAAVQEPQTPCRIAAAASLVGKPLTPALQQEAQAKVGARSVRVIRPNSPVTMDYRPDRLNIEVDAGNNVTRFRCG